MTNAAARAEKYRHFRIGLFIGEKRWDFGRARSGPTSLCGYPTSTAAATTVVHRPFLSPTAVCVTFWVRTISFDSR